jgi:hypothetical protein
MSPFRNIAVLSTSRICHWERWLGDVGSPMKLPHPTIERLVGQ